MTKIITIEDIEKNSSSFWDAIKTVPFGNSTFQTQNMVAKKWTSGRVQRQILIELWNRVKTLNSCTADKRRDEIKLKKAKRVLEDAQEELKARIEDREAALPENKDDKSVLRAIEDAQFAVEEAQIDVDTATFAELVNQKMFDDCVTEVNTYLELLQKIASQIAQELGQKEPVLLTREQFEGQEKEYFTKLFLASAKYQGLSRLSGIEQGTLEEFDKLGLEASVDQLVLDTMDDITGKQKVLGDQKTEVVAKLAEGASK